MWRTGLKKHFPRESVLLGWDMCLCESLLCSCLLWQGDPSAGCPCSPLHFPLCRPHRISRQGQRHSPAPGEGAQEGWGLQPCFNAETATGLNLDQHPRCWYLCWYQVWLSQGDLSVCFAVGEQAREEVQRAALRLEKVSFKNHHVCLILKFTANALSVASAVSQPLISLCVF